MITRNNYEEFFLLYVDNELSPPERQAVERFVVEHPDLKEEWDLLLQCRVSPDKEASFPGIASLLKFGAPTSSIDLQNYETWFLSYIDGELSGPDRQTVIDFLRQHPEKNIELQQLQRTVNTPDLAIVFPDKESLYRKEEKRKIAWLPFARIAAAAIVLGIIGVLIFHPFRQDHPLAKNPSSNKHTPPTVTPIAPSHDSSTPILAEAIQPVIKKQPRTVTPRHADPLYLSTDGQKKTDVAISDPTPATRDTAISSGLSNRVASSDPARHLTFQEQKMTDPTIKMPVYLAVNTDQASNTAKTNASFASQALLSQTGNTDDDSQEETASPRKNRLRGIFRKVARTLEKPAAREDDDNKKVIIGGFQFALK